MLIQPEDSHNKHAEIIIKSLRDNPCVNHWWKRILAQVGYQKMIWPVKFFNVRKSGPDWVSGEGQSIAELDFDTFSGVQIKYPSVNPPLTAFYAFQEGFKVSQISSSVVPDHTLAPGSLYIYVGLKP